MKIYIPLLFLAFSLMFPLFVKGQNPAKEATNAFAHFTKTQDIIQLEAARKNIDEAYKTQKDSLSFKNNLIRAMVYSALAVVDSNRKFTYVKDPLLEASYSLNLLKSEKFNTEFEPEIEFIKNQLARGYLFEATTAVMYSNFEEAAIAFTKVDTLLPGNLNITHNLAIIYEKLRYPEKAILYYKKLIAENPKPAYYFSLSELYSLGRHQQLALDALQEGRAKFPKDKDLVFKELNYFAEKHDYATVVNLLPNALKIDEYSIPLNFLAGFSYEMVGDVSKAEEHYEKVLNIDPNNYDANYALGLLNLTSYVKKQDKKQFIYVALQHLSKANEIDPNQVKPLESLAILYHYSGDEVQLQKVNNKINQLKLN